MTLEWFCSLLSLYFRMCLLLMAFNGIAIQSRISINWNLFTRLYQFLSGKKRNDNANENKNINCILTNFSAVYVRYHSVYLRIRIIFLAWIFVCIAHLLMCFGGSFAFIAMDIRKIENTVFGNCLNFWNSSSFYGIRLSGHLLIS